MAKAFEELPARDKPGCVVFFVGCLPALAAASVLGSVLEKTFGEGHLAASEFVGDRTAEVLKDSTFPSRDAAGAIEYVDATLLARLKEPTREGERSYLIEIRVDCVTGNLGTYYVSSHADLEGAGAPIREWSAGDVDYVKPEPPLDSIARRLCDQT